MSLADELLHQARFLAELNPGLPPKQVDLRRAVSSAYYAIFHLLCDETAQCVGAGLPLELRVKTQRALEHKDMYTVAGVFVKEGKDKIDEKAIVLPGPISRRLANIANGFRTLQEQRHVADYDVLKSFDRVEVLELVATAEDAFADWNVERTTANAQVFLATLAFWKFWKK
jgi:uncharacterized protein (UPF0332 family)